MNGWVDGGGRRMGQGGPVWMLLLEQCSPSAILSFHVFKGMEYVIINGVQDVVLTTAALEPNLIVALGKSRSI